MKRIVFGLCSLIVVIIVASAEPNGLAMEPAREQASNASLQQRVVALERAVEDLKSEISALRGGLQPAAAGTPKLVGTWINTRTQLALDTRATEWKRIEFVDSNEVNATFSNDVTHLYQWHLASDRIVIDTQLFRFETDGKTLKLTDSSGRSGTFVRK